MKRKKSGVRGYGRRLIFPLRREGNPARAETAPPEGGTIGKTTFAPAKAKKEGSAGVRSLFLAFCPPFPNALRPRARRKTGASAACAAFAALFPPKQVLLLITSALICPAAIASRLPLPKSVFPFLPPALLSCRDCFFPFRADCLHSCIVSAEKRFYLSFKQPAPAAKAAGAGCLRSISAKIRRKTDGFPCRGASFVCAAWERNALSPPAFSLGPNARTAPHALSRRARLWPCPSVPALRSNRRRSLAFCPSRPPLEHSAIPARAFCAGGDCGSQQTRAGGGRVREKCVVRGKAKCKTKRSGAGNLPRSALSAEKRLIRRAFSILRERSPQAPPRRRARPLRQRPGCTPSALPGWGNRCCCSREVARRR